MMEILTSADHDDRGIKLLEEWLPMLNRKKRAYLKGATEALLYAQEGMGTTKMEQHLPDACLSKK